MENNSEKTIQPVEENTKKNKSLLGFRTDKVWKKLISISYLAFCVLFAIFAVSMGRKGQITSYDYWIDKASYIILAFSLFCPYVFLSDTKFRDKLPLFKKHSAGASTLGLLIVFVILFILFGTVYSAHSAEYKEDMKSHAYTVVSSTDASCENDGEVKKLCEYCGKEITEIIPRTGHKMAEVSRKAATEKEEGQIVNECSVCGKQETVLTDKLTAQNVTTKEATEATAKAPAASATTQATVPTTEFEWKSAIFNLYNGVELYIVTDSGVFLYGVVTDYDYDLHQVQVYLAEGDNFMWFPTRTESFLNKLKVRSDDPRLPENMVNN